MKLCRIMLIVSVILIGYVLAMSLPPWLLLIAGVLLLARKGYTQLSAMGTARWANITDLRRAGMLGGNGMILGRAIAPCPAIFPAIIGLFNPWVKSSVACEQFLGSLRRFNRKKDSAQPLVRMNALHTTVFAPSGAGKNVSIITPFLLSSPENCIIIDVKGESAELTAAHREKVFGHKCVRIDPFRVTTKTPASFNVLDSIDPSDPESLDQIRAIAEAIVEKNPNDRDPHWQQKAQIFITGIIAAVLHFCPPGRRGLQEVASIMADMELFNAAISRMRQSDAYDGILARMGSEMSHSTGKELEGILSTANRSLTFLSTVAVAESTGSTSGFDAAELSDANGQGITIYLVLPVQYLRSHAGLMRLWVTGLMRSVVKAGIHNRRPVNVILDEVAQIGRLEAIEDMLTIGRSFGLKITAILQSMAQLKKMFPEDHGGVLLSNTSQVFFAVNDKETAEYVSDRLGEETIVVESSGANQGGSVSGEPNSASRSWGSNRSYSQQARRLLKPEEVTALDPRIAITLTPGVPPLWTRLIRYYEGFQESAFSRFYGKAEMVITSILFLCLTLWLAVKVFQKGGG